MTLRIAPNLLVLMACQEPYREVDGRYVRYRTTSDLPLCAGLVEHVDEVVEGIFAVLEEKPPAEFVFNYHWFPGEDMDLSPCDPSGQRGCAQVNGGEISVYSPLALEPHEIAHAVHFASLPSSKTFLYEGFATLFHREGALVAGFNDATGWDDGVDLDALLDATTAWKLDQYEPAFKIVSWTVQRHGMTKFKKFWRSVEREASLGEVRAAYESVFGESIEAMIAGQVSSYASACTIPLCGDEAPIPWDGDRWSFSEPFNCEDDPTIGPLTESHPLGARLVYLDVATAGLHRITASGDEGGGAILERCAASCPSVQSFRIFHGQPDQRELGVGRYKVALFRRYAPDEPPPAVEIEYLAEP